MQRTTTQLRSYKCPNCAAPFEVVPNVDTLICAYCHNAIQVRRTNMAPPSLPQEQARYVLHVPHEDPFFGNRGAPMPPNDFGAAPAMRSTKVTGAIIGGTIFFGVVVMRLVLTFGSHLPWHAAIKPHPVDPGGAIHGDLPPGVAPPPPPPAAITLPMECSNGATPTVDGQSYDGGATAVTVQSDCTLTIKNSHIKGKISVQERAIVSIENSEITSDGIVINLMEYDRLTLTNTTIHSLGIGTGEAADPKKTATAKKSYDMGAAVRGGFNAEIALVNSHVIGDKCGIATDDMPKIALDNASAVSGSERGVLHGKQWPNELRWQGVERPRGHRRARRKCHRAFAIGGRHRQGLRSRFGLRSRTHSRWQTRERRDCDPR
jgi:hypothetical protein